MRDMEKLEKTYCSSLDDLSSPELDLEGRVAGADSNRGSTRGDPTMDVARTNSSSSSSSSAAPTRTGKLHEEHPPSGLDDLAPVSSPVPSSQLQQSEQVSSTPVAPKSTSDLQNEQALRASSQAESSSSTSSSLQEASSSGEECEGKT